MLKMKLLAAVLLAAITGWSAGTPSNPSKPTPKPSVAKNAAVRTRPDAEIEKDIRAKFAKSKINAEKFQVHVQGGVATIDGRTEVIQHKGVATRLAKGGGAIAVSNHIQISEAAREKAAENLESGRRRVQVKRTDSRTQANPAR